LGFSSDTCAAATASPPNRVEPDAERDEQNDSQPLETSDHPRHR
jgi:hypothetical protein